MIVDTSVGAERSFYVPSARTTKVVKNKNTGQSFWVKGYSEGKVELQPVLGKDILINQEDFTSESWHFVP